MRVKNEMLEIIKDKVELQKSVEYQRVSAEIEDIMNDLRGVLPAKRSKYFNREMFDAIGDLERIIIERVSFTAYDVISHFCRELLLGVEQVEIEDFRD